MWQVLLECFLIIIYIMKAILFYGKVLPIMNYGKHMENSTKVLASIYYKFDIIVSSFKAYARVLPSTQLSTAGE